MNFFIPILIPMALVVGAILGYILHDAISTARIAASNDADEMKKSAEAEAAKVETAVQAVEKIT
jgi:hypothetical protein